MEGLRAKTDAFIKSLAEDFDKEVDSLVKRRNNLTEECTRLEERKEALKQDIEVMGSKMVFTSPVHVNVGGVIYTTSIGTLTRVKDSMLESMFSGRHQLTPQGRQLLHRPGRHSFQTHPQLPP